MAEPEFHRIRRLPPYVFAEVNRLKAAARAAGKDIIDLGMGNPDSPTPPHIVEKLVETVRDGKTHRYSTSRGIPGLRKAWAGYYARRFGVRLDPETQVCVTLGSKEGLANLAQAITAPGDTILSPNPSYPIHPFGFIIAGASIRHVPFGPRIDLMRELARAAEHSVPAPSAVVLNFPSNPTALTCEPEFYKEVVAWAKQRGIWLLSDIAYAEIYFGDRPPPSILEAPGAFDVAIEFGSLSKTYSMPGWRIGFAAGNTRLVSALTRIKSYLDYGAFTPIQVAAAAALNGPQECVQGFRELYRDRRDVLIDGLAKAGWQVPRPEATMFCWAPVPEPFGQLGLVGLRQAAAGGGRGRRGAGDRFRRVWRRLCPPGGRREPAPAASGGAQHPRLSGAARQRGRGRGARCGMSIAVHSPVRIGIAGLGTVGAATFRLLRDNAELLTQRTGRALAVTAVSARDRGRRRDFDLAGVRWHDDARALAEDPQVDLVCELIGGSDGVALELVRASLGCGRSVVTANKAMLAHHGAELAALAEDAKAQLRFEAAVAGGIPIIRSLRDGLVANRILRVSGILNGTSNFILTTMRETGREFADVLTEAQRLGYAEADPAFDVDGIDAAHKLSLLAAVAFGGRPRFDAIHIEGIRHVSATDIAFADQLGYRIKLLGVARMTEQGLEQRLHPCMVPIKAPIAQVEGVYNAVVVEGRPGGCSDARGPRRRRRPDRLGRGGRPHRACARPRGADLRGARSDAARPSDRADGGPCGQLLHPADGARRAGRAGRHLSRAARPRGLHRIADPAWPQPGPGGADCADQPRYDRGADERGAGAHRGPARSHRTATDDPYRAILRENA